MRSVAAAAGDPRRVTRGDIKRGQQQQSLQTAARGLSLKCKSEHSAILLTACCGSPLPLRSTTSKILHPAPKGLLSTGLFHSRSPTPTPALLRPPTLYLLISPLSCAQRPHSMQTVPGPRCRMLLQSCRPGKLLFILQNPTQHLLFEEAVPGPLACSGYCSVLS